MTKYINPYTDFGFKKLFGEEANKDLLIDFLNQLLPHKHKIADLDFTNKEQLPDNIKERNAFFDIVCKSKTGERFIVEMQKGRVNNSKDRTLYYLTNPIRNQAQKGKDWNYYLDPVYFIGVMDFNYEPIENMELMRSVHLKDQFNEVFYDKLGIIYLQMPAFNKTVEQLETHFDKWLFFLQNLENLNDIPAMLNEPIFKKAFEIAEYTNLPSIEQQQYEKSKLDYYSWDLVMDASKSEGIEIGKHEREIEIAINLKKLNISINAITKATGLSEQEIEDL